MTFPYRVVKTHTSDKPEYYGIFREVAETPKALIKLQLMVNTRKHSFDGAVANLVIYNL